MRVLAALAVVVAVALALWQRLQDPLSSPVIVAEDPFTHMALVRGHLLDGSLDPLYEGGRLYPPGMHAVLAAVWVYSGVELEVIFRFGPAVLGAIGVLGVAVLLWRGHGPGAAVVGALAAATAPEAIFRTTMMAPTALDFAILPFLLLAVVETLRGRLEWAAIVAVMAAFLTVSHPWLLAILAPACFGLVISWLRLGTRKPSGTGAGAVLATLAIALLAAISSCWSQCALGTQTTPADRIDELALVGAAAGLVGAAVCFTLRRVIAGWRAQPHWILRAALSAALAAALYWGSRPAFDAGLPEHVAPLHMIGMPVLALAAFGFVLLPWLPTRAGLAGASLAAVTYPFVIYDLFNSPYWPHRTALYLAIAAALLAGVAASMAARSVVWLALKLARPTPR